ncbi:hypothetical protein EB73_26465 [Mycobacterium sp. SWH-M3]|nr:hypothetical protein EB73_26465 [Mycobacterium sp. SWH-M3]
MTDMTTAETAELIATVAATAAKATMAHMAASVPPSTPTTARKPVATPKAKRAPMTAAQLARKREHLAVCVHEAAHAVAGVVLGAELRNAVVASGAVTGVRGLTGFYTDSVPPGRQPEIDYAGPYGQAKFQAGGNRPTSAQMRAVLDGHGQRDCAGLNLAGGAHLGHGAQPLIDRCWPAVLRVAQQLDRAGEVFEADVLAALGITDGGGRTSAQLALLRSNMRTVPPFTMQPAPA